MAFRMSNLGTVWPAIAAAFLASLVEAIEAFTIVLAVATVQGWKPAIFGSVAGLVMLAAIILALGPLLGAFPIHALQFVIGVLLLLFGQRWLRKAVLRAAGIIPLHDETAAFAAVVVIGLSLGWHVASAARSATWWNSSANAWTPQIAQPGFKLVGGLALALLFGKSMVGPLFAQTAWTNVTFVGSEVRDPAKNLVRALVAGCGIVVVLYLLANVAYLAVLPFPEIQHAPQNRVAVAMMNAVFGHPGAMCMAAAIMISTFGCNNGLILSGGRVYYAMARDRLFFQKVATTNRFHVPAPALVAQAIWTAFLTLPRTATIDAATHEVAYGNVYNQLLEYIVSADLLFYVLMVVAVMILRRKRPDAERPYRMWGYPIVPVISILLAGLLIVDLAWLAPTTSGIGILIVLTGVPAYFFWRKLARA